MKKIDCHGALTQYRRFLKAKEVFEDELKKVRTMDEIAYFLKQKDKISELKQEVYEKIWPFEHVAMREVIKEYKAQVALLKESGIAQRLEGGEYGVRDLISREKEVPSWEEVRHRLMKKKEILDGKFKQGFTQMLLVPFGMSLNQLMGVLGSNLIKFHEQGKLFSPQTKRTKEEKKLLHLDIDHPITFWGNAYKEGDRNKKLSYYLKAPNSPAKTWVIKGNCLLQGDNPCWQVLFLQKESFKPPRERSKRTGGRKDLGYGLSAEGFLKKMRGEEYKYESALTPEDWIIKFLAHLYDTGEVSNCSNNISQLVGCLYNEGEDFSSRACAYWHDELGQVRFDTGHMSDDSMTEGELLTCVRI